MTTFVRPTLEEIEAVVSSSRTFDRYPAIPSTNPTRERWYDWQLPPVDHGPQLAIRWYTSVVEQDGVARDCGKDAMRVCVVKSPTSKNEKVIYASPRIHRTKGWQNRIKNRVALLFILVTRGDRCPACGARMTPKAARSRDRKKVLRLFWSCTRYPHCKGTKRGTKGSSLEKMAKDLIR
jgi:hypothetical protein